MKLLVAPKGSTQRQSEKLGIIKKGETWYRLNTGLMSSFSDNLTWMAFIASHMDVHIKNEMVMSGM